MSNITLLPNRTNEINQEAVKLLTALLADAQEGKLIEIAYTAVAPDGTIETGHSPFRDACRVLGGISMLQYRIAAAVDDVSDDLQAPTDDEA